MSSRIPHHGYCCEFYPGMAVNRLVGSISLFFSREFPSSPLCVLSYLVSLVFFLVNDLVTRVSLSAGVSPSRGAVSFSAPINVELLPQAFFDYPYSRTETCPHRYGRSLLFSSGPRCLSPCPPPLLLPPQWKPLSCRVGLKKGVKLRRCLRP